MSEKFATNVTEGGTALQLEVDPTARALLVEALKGGTDEAWVMMGEMMDHLEAQIKGNSAEEMCALFDTQAAIYFDAGLVDAGISSLNDAHIYAHQRVEEALASAIRDEIIARGGTVVYELY